MRHAPKRQLTEDEILEGELRSKTDALGADNVVQYDGSEEAVAALAATDADDRGGETIDPEAEPFGYI